MAGTQSPTTPAVADEEEQRYAVPLDVHAWGGGSYADVSPPPARPSVQAALGGGVVGQQLPVAGQANQSGFETFRLTGPPAIRLGGMMTAPGGYGVAGSPGGGARLGAFSCLNHSTHKALASRAPEPRQALLRRCRH